MEGTKLPKEDPGSAKNRVTAPRPAEVDEWIAQHCKDIEEMVERCAGPELLQHATVEDLAQDVVCVMLDPATPFQFRSERELSAWVNTCVRSMVTDVGRRYRRRRAAEPERCDLERLAAALRAEGDPSTLLMEVENVQGLRVALGRQSAHDRKLLRWVYMLGLPLRHVGRWLGCTPDSARTMAWRALQRLRAELAALEHSCGAPAGRLGEPMYPNDGGIGCAAVPTPASGGARTSRPGAPGGGTQDRTRSADAVDGGRVRASVAPRTWATERP
jgi:RNA polymerase sigma factor (sigma-70 family)